MGINQHKLDAGMVYLLAMALHRRNAGHAGVIEAIEWLRDHGHSREAQRLTDSLDRCIVAPKLMEQC